MKKIYTAILMAAVALSFASCKNEIEDIFGASAAQRLNYTQAKYTSLLTASQYGWAFEYYPTSSTSDGAVLYALKFNNDGSVDVAGDPFGTGVIKHEVSCWDIITDNGPTLSFSTYNTLIHQFADPMDDGSGYEGDYEFSFVYSATENPDSVIMLKGKKRGLYCRLKMIDEDVTPAEFLTDCANKQASLFPESAKNYVLLHIGDDLIRMDDMNSGVPDCYNYGMDKVLFSVPNSYMFVKYSGKYFARFNDMFTSENGEVQEKHFVYDEDAQEFVGMNNPSVKITAPYFGVFFMDELMAGNVEAWRLTRNSEMSDEFAAAWSKAYSAMSKKNNTINECVLSTNNKGEDNNVTLSIKYKPKTGAAREVFYKYNMTVEDNVVTLTYIEPLNSGAENILKNIPECEEILNAVAGTYTVTNPGNMQLIVNSLKLNSADGKSFSMLAKYANNSTTTN